MPLSSLQTGTVVPAPVEAVFDLWLDPVRLGLVTGGVAHIDANVSGHYSMFGGSIVGEYVFIKRPDVVAQTWRSEEFDAGMEDSRLEVSFRKVAAGTHVGIVHAHIPPVFKEQFLYGWDQFLLPRIVEHFRGPVH
jgi:activator of HSP90 ATPase